MKRTPYAATATAATALAGALIAGTASANTAAGPEAAAPRPGRWDFAVTLDDKPIGRHRFELAGDPATGEWTLKSQAEYDVKILGLTVYTYRHSATERWRAGCLAQLEARTDDNGDVTSVQPAAAPGSEPPTSLRIAVRSDDRAIAAAAAASAGQDARGCQTSYAYWNPGALRQRSQLLNPQTGRLDPVQGSALPATSLVVGGQPVQAQGWRLRTPKGPVDVWSAADGRWIGLDATVSGDRRLRYRLP